MKNPIQKYQIIISISAFIFFILITIKEWYWIFIPSMLIHYFVYIYLKIRFKESRLETFSNNYLDLLPFINTALQYYGFEKTAVKAGNRTAFRLMDTSYWYDKEMQEFFTSYEIPRNSFEDYAKPDYEFEVNYCKKIASDSDVKQYVVSIIEGKRQEILCKIR